MEDTRGCDNCKHCDKKITESPCDICNGWHSRWEAKEEVTENAKTTL